MNCKELYNVFTSCSNYDKKVNIWTVLRTNDKYKFLNLLMKSKDEKLITFLMGMDFITLEQHLFLVELNHDYKNNFEFIDHDTALQLFKPKLLDKNFLFDVVFTYINESKHIFNISNLDHLTKIKSVLIQIYKKYNSKFGTLANASASEQTNKEVIYDDDFDFLSLILKNYLSIGITHKSAT